MRESDDSAVPSTPDIVSPFVSMDRFVANVERPLRDIDQEQQQLHPNQQTQEVQEQVEKQEEQLSVQQEEQSSEYSETETNPELQTAASMEALETQGENLDPSFLTETIAGTEKNQQQDYLQQTHPLTDRESAKATEAIDSVFFSKQTEGTNAVAHTTMLPQESR